MSDFDGMIEVIWDGESYLFGDIDYSPNIRGRFILKKVGDGKYNIIAKFRNDKVFSDFFKWFQSMPAFVNIMEALEKEGRRVI